MNPEAKKIQTTYLALLLFSTLSASLIWGVNTLFLLDAGLSNTEAFAANAFFTLGMMLFEVPTGVVADSRGRRLSFLLGTLTLSLSTLIYVYLWVIGGPFWAWALSSVFIGLGFTFFSGATEAWLVDALDSVKYKGPLESVFAKGQIITGVAMLAGSFAGGLIAQFTNLGVPYYLRVGLLLVTFVIAYVMMKDLGFKPERGRSALHDMKKIFNTSLDVGIKNPSVRWIMIAAPFGGGVGIYAFYAAQPYLLELYGDKEAYLIAGLMASIFAGAQILGGLSVGYVRRLFKKRTSMLLASAILSVGFLAGIGLIQNFWVALGLFVLWALIFAASFPVRQAYLNGVIPSKQRATVLSFDSLMSSAGGVAFQPGLGKVADVSGYAASYVVSSAVYALAMPFLILAKRQKEKADIIA